MTNKDYDNAVDEIISIVKSRPNSSKRDTYLIKKQVCEKYGIERIIPDAEILDKSKLPIFSRKPTRKMSGVSVIAVMTSPYKCPHGKCVFCPGGVEYMTPQSYTGREPAALRAEANSYEPYKQVKNRLVQYEAIGQVPSKVDLIIMGGTFTSRSKKYKTWFIKECLRALNDSKDGTLLEMQRLNENAEYRCVGLTVETRPSEINKKTIKELLMLGVTRVELGVQSVYDDVLTASNRGHSVKDTIIATKLLKDAGFKINYHMMTNLPNSNVKRDYSSFKTIFTNSSFKPDMVKIYPTLLIKGTKLYEMYLDKAWTPYSLAGTVNLIARIKRIVPKYVRIMRIQRDIPSYLIEQDLKSSNLRQLVNNEMVKQDWECKCIRCRESGRNNGDLTKAVIKTTHYLASNGAEHFIEFSDNSVLFGFLRLRVKDRTAFVRELHVYGEQVSFGGAPSIQHRGIGKMLMTAAEKIARKNKSKLINVISGVGVRGYYKKLGYELRNGYMTKDL